MTGLKLARLEDRTPVKLAIAVTPQLNADLQLYASLYRETYGVEESLACALGKPRRKKSEPNGARCPRREALLASPASRP